MTANQTKKNKRPTIFEKEAKGDTIPSIQAFFQRSRQILSVIFVVLILASCGPTPEELYETAELEMLQTNYPHATKLYTEIIEKHPKSKFAETARIRLKEIKEKEGEVSK